MRFVLLVWLTVFSTPVFAQTFGEDREFFGDWLAACRPTGYCSATAYDNPNPPNGSVADYILRVGRHEQGTYWEISLTTVASMPGEFADMNFDIDGQVQTFTQNFDYGAYSSINDFFFVSYSVQELLDQMIAGSQINVGFNDVSQAEQFANFSLAGLSAAILWIDEQQKRIGSERVAYAAPIGLTPVSHEFPVSVPSQLIEQHANDGDCVAFEDLPGAYRVMGGPLNDGQWAYFIPCTAGAYNLSYKAYLGDGENFYSVNFAQFDDRLGWTGTPFLVNPTYDRQTTILTSYYRGRGLGDCGSTGIWQWDEYDFAMLEYRSKDTCDEQGEPGVFPVIFQSDSYEQKLKR